ncbi:MAG: hypothetical protein J6T43_02460 [Prevotella sp.]|nr:hypothetical protein [Prevotella sp.]
MKIEIKEINLEEKIKDFSQYLATTDRIILSAKFGDGKTYLLNQLRNNEELNKEYKFFTIYPVNYSVAKNEDIFEYIKRDIIVQLDKEGLLDNVDLNAVFDSLFNFEDIKALVAFLLSFIPGGAFYDIVFQKFCEKKKEYKEKKHTGDKYLALFSQIKGSIYENDGYTSLIRNAIDWMKKDHAMNGPEWKKKKAVLIIEDLDRLDPKHLFRILNVLSAHIDDTTTPDVVTNKFGFDNIVLVMDYETTAHIFHHFYGKDACYEGYMSKFLSREPFKYSIQPFIAIQIERELSKKLGVSHIFMTFSKFWMKIHNLSIRDLKKLTMFDTQDRIRSDSFEYKHMKFSTSLPLFHLIIYMVECGMSVDEIVTDLKTKITHMSKGERRIMCQEYMRLSYPLYAIMNNREFTEFSYGTEKYSVTVKSENGIITEVSVSPADTWVSSNLVKIEELDIEETVRWCLSEFSTCINLAALCDTKKT